MKGTRRLGGMIAVAALAAAACSGGTGQAEAGPAQLGDASAATVPSSVPGSPTPAPSATTATDESPDVSPDVTVGVPAGCSPLTGGAPWTSEVTAAAVSLQERGPARAGVEAVVYPHPDYAGKLWSQWGQGIALPDGRLLSAIGDHLGADGNSYLYDYDPATKLLTQIGDALSSIDHVPGDWGFGKVHAPMVAGPCGEVYVATYWGSRRNLVFTDGYQGDVLLRLDPDARTIENRGVILPEHGVASMAAWPEGGLIYAEAADPFGNKTGSFVVLDMATGERIFENDDDAHDGYRSIAVDIEGRAYISWNADRLARYDPATNSLEALDVALPGEMLRWATPPDAFGTVYGVTRDPGIFFTLGPNGAVAELAPTRGYTTSIALAPDGRRFFYVPGAHGSAWEQGTPLIAVDVATGEHEVVVELNPLLEDAFGLRGGGTYNVVVDPSGERVYVGINAGDVSTRAEFGEVVLVIVTLP